MTRRFLTLGAAGVLLAGAAALSLPASAAPGGAACQLQGTANFSPGLTTSSQAFTYTFGGTLTGCQSSIAGAPTSGTISTPSAANGTGSCGSSTTTGTAVVNWNDGTASTISYSTTSAGALVQLTGTVIDSSNAALQTGMDVQGALTFSTTTPQACASGGLSSAAINGVTGVGSTS